MYKAVVDAVSIKGKRMAVLVKQWIENAELESLLGELKEINKNISRLSEEIYRIERSKEKETEYAAVKVLSEYKRDCQAALNAHQIRHKEIMGETSGIACNMKIIIDYDYHT